MIKPMAIATSKTETSTWPCLWPIGFLALLLLPRAGGQMQFEIPAEMLQGMMGGFMGGGGSRRKPTEWPKTENSEISAEFEWLVNTEWKGKTAKYLLLRDGLVESSLKECEHEGQCLWAANNGHVLINTPTLKVVRFKVEGLESVDAKRLDNKDEVELQKVKLIAAKVGKSGKKSQLEFHRIAMADDTDSFITEDLYSLLAVPEDAEQSTIKSKFRRLSVQHHPDKGGDPKIFGQMREAFEVLGDVDKRKYYSLGGMQLVKNVELAWKEVEGQKAQLDAQISQVPKNHPQYQQFKMQIDAQKRQFERVDLKGEIEKKFRSEDMDVYVPISAQELYNGVSKKEFVFQRLVLCRGCRADPTKPECIDCGRCPPEKVQVPKYGMTPFGKQVVGMTEKEQESRERCREVNVPITNLRVPKGAKEGATLKYVADVGHQTPGKLPGKIHLKVQRGSSNDTYTIAESDLHTVLHISLEQALFGFSISWKHLGAEEVAVTRSSITTPEEVVKIKKKGLLGEGGARGDLYVRLVVDMPTPEPGSKSLALLAPSASEGTPEAKLEREEPIELREGAAWRMWRARNAARAAPTEASSKSGAGRQEL